MISKSISVSRKLAKVSPFSALLFTWLVPHCDDGGNMPGDPFTIKGLVVPVRPETVDDVDKAILEISEAGLVEQYQQDGEIYIHVVGWEKHQTLRKDRATWLYPRQPNGNQAATKRQPAGAGARSEGKVSEGKVREENTTQSSSAQSADGAFDEFWKAYPRKEGKGAARRSWTKIKKPATLLPRILASLEEHKKGEQWQREGGRFVPHPATFLNQERWDDEVEEAPEQKIMEFK